MSRLMLISCGIQWLAQAARYFSQAHLYLNGTSWLTSVLPLMMRLSSTRMRRKPSGLLRHGSPSQPSASRCATALGAVGTKLAVHARPHRREFRSCSRCRVVELQHRRFPNVRFCKQALCRSDTCALTGTPRMSGCRSRRTSARSLRRARRRIVEVSAAAMRDIPAVCGHRVQLPRLHRRFLGVRRAQRAQVVGGLQAAQPGELVGLVQLLARGAGHVDVERLRLVDPLLAPRRRLDQPRAARPRTRSRRGCAAPAGRGRSCARVPSKYLRSVIITSSHRPSRFRSATRYSLTTVNSPDRFDFTYRFW